MAIDVFGVDISPVMIVCLTARGEGRRRPGGGMPDYGGEHMDH